MKAIYNSSQYNISPNDLQILADAPAQQLFVLCGPVDEESKNEQPCIVCVVQVCLEGHISKESALKRLRDGGHSPYGDQIPWKFCEQFRDPVFPTLSGARIVRIAVHPNATKREYEFVAVEQLTRYFEGQPVEASPVRVTKVAEKVPPLLVDLCDPPRTERLHYLGVSFGLTLDLFRFWREHKFAPFYISQIPVKKPRNQRF